MCVHDAADSPPILLSCAGNGHCIRPSMRRRASERRAGPDEGRSCGISGIGMQAKGCMANRHRVRIIDSKRLRLWLTPCCRNAPTAPTASTASTASVYRQLAPLSSQAEPSSLSVQPSSSPVHVASAAPTAPTPQRYRRPDRCRTTELSCGRLPGATWTSSGRSSGSGKSCGAQTGPSPAAAACATTCARTATAREITTGTNP